MPVKTVLYDVCNDYSLDPCTTEFDAKLYRSANRNGGIVYTHKKYNEIHYYLGKPGLNGQNLFAQGVE